MTTVLDIGRLLPRVMMAALLSFLLLVLMPAQIPSPAFAGTTCSANIDFSSLGLENAVTFDASQSGACDSNNVGLFSSASALYGQTKRIGYYGAENFTGSKGNTYRFIFNGVSHSLTLVTQVAPGPETLTFYYFFGAMANGAPTNGTYTINLTLPSPLPTITGISPASGPVAGGTTVAITGTKFNTASPTGAVKFGSKTATYTINSNTSLTAKAPAGLAGIVDVTITTTGGTSVTTSADRFTYLKATPTLAVAASGASPAFGASVTFSAQLAGASSASGAISFYDGSTLLGTGTISGNIASLATTALPPGAHTITASYAGDANNEAATSTTNASVTVGKAAPVLAVTASDTSPAFGASVTFSAQLSGASAATGAISFYDGSTLLGTGTITSGTATFDTTDLIPGAHMITASYAGDANNDAATSTTNASVTVGKAAPVLAVTASDTSPAFGTSVTFSAQLSGASSATGAISFYDGSTLLGTGTITSGTATFDTTDLIPGAHMITASYAGDANNDAATSTTNAGVTVGKAAPVLVVTASDTSPAFGASVTFSAQLSSASSATGAISFYDGSTLLGTGTISGDLASFDTTDLTTGAHTITASYAGDAGNDAATSATAVTVTVTKATSVLRLSASSTSPDFGTSVTFTATLPNAQSPTGEIEFYDGSTLLGTGAITGTSASFSTSVLAAGLHTITASYAGDENNNAATSVSGRNVTVGKAMPMLSLTTSESNPAHGAPVTFTAILANASSPSGLVEFFDNSTSLGTSAITGMTATLSTSMLAPGAHSIVAVYAGDAGNTTATSTATTVTVDRATAAITVSANRTNPAFGEQVTFTATLSSGVTTTGTVEFFDGSTSLGTGTVSAAAATVSSSVLTVGAHSITARYSGDTNNSEASSTALSMSVGQAASTVTVAADKASPAFGEQITYSATLSGVVSATGTVEFFDGSTSLGTDPVSRMTASVSSSGLTVGTHTITAKYSGDTNNAEAISTVLSVTVGLATSTITVSADKTNPAFAEQVTFTATLSGGAAPTGTVEFFDGSTSLGTSGLSGTTATLSRDDLTVGTHAITARYNGDTNNARDTSEALSVTIGKLVPAIAVSADKSNPVFAEQVTFTATLSGGTSPTGTVEFFDGSTSLGTRDISGTTATLPTATLAVGAHSITARYSGDTNNGQVVSAVFSISVGQVGSAVTLSADKPNPAFGERVTFTATLSGSVSPEGTVEFFDGSTSVGTATVSGITATLQTAALTIGAHSVTARYSGDTQNAQAVSAPLAVTVGQRGTTLVLTVDKATPTFGAQVTFTATLSGSVSPEGTVEFFDGSTSLGNGALANATATLSTSALTVGTHAITGKYSGDERNAPATSAALPITVKQAAVFTFAPAAGVLESAMAGEDYSQQITATGGSGALTYSIASGKLPAGMVLNVSTGELTGPLDADTEGHYSFVIEARDGSGATGTARFTLDVKEREVTVSDQTVTVPAGGVPANVDLTARATGGPFSSVELTIVEPANAGTASVVRGEFAALGPTPLGWYLKFVPNPTYSGKVRVGFRLTSALGVSNSGTVTYTLSYDPAMVADDIDRLVHGFVQTRQNLIVASVKVPGLLERRQMETATDPVTARMMPSQDGMTLGLSTSLAQLEAARNNADGIAGAELSPFNIWIDGTFAMHNREENGNRWGDFGMMSAGADLLLSEKALIGLSFHYDHMTDPTDEDALLTGNGWMAGPYASLEIGKDVFWDTSLLYGGSFNDIDTAFWNGSFDTSRWMLDTSISGQWALGKDTIFTPKLRAVYFSETVADYAVKNGSGDMLDIEGFDEEQLRVSLGAEIARSFTLEGNMTLTPKLGLTGGFSGLDGSGAFGQVSAGLSLATADSWSIDTSVLFGVEGEGQKTLGAKAGVNGRF